MTHSAASDKAARVFRPRTGFGFPRVARVRRARDIRRAMREGRRSRGRLADAFAVPSLIGRPRVGIVAPRFGRAAVARNRVRRRIAEIARLDLLPALEGRQLQLDVVVRAKPAAYDASYRALRDALLVLIDSVEAACAR